MFFDFGGGWTCNQCGILFDFIPADTAEQFERLPAGSTWVPASQVQPAKWADGPFWASTAWPRTCVRCDAQGWVVPGTSAGASFFRP